jgi:predicted nuclease of restriction endonuclease-like (RecB) superfamily
MTLKKSTITLHLDQTYRAFIQDMQTRLKTAQIRAALASNQALIHFYWQVGKELVEKQKPFQWGEKLLEQFFHDIRQECPGMLGFSVTNLKRMKLFALAYPDFVMGAQAVPQLPWGHIIVLLHRTKGAEVRTWYAQQTIQGKAHERAIEDALVAHVRDFLLELGQGFFFVGSQVPLTFIELELNESLNKKTFDKLCELS